MEKSQVINVLTTEARELEIKQSYVKELIKKFEGIEPIIKREDLPKNNKVELEVVKKKPSEAKTKNITIEDNKVKIPTQYDNKLSWPSKILYCISRGMNTANDITTFIYSNQTGVKKEVSNVRYLVQFYIYEMSKQGILNKEPLKPTVFSIK